MVEGLNMAMFVAIKKEYENEEKVLYSCGPSKNELMAKFEIIKSTGEIIEIESVPKISRQTFLCFIEMFNRIENWRGL